MRTDAKTRLSGLGCVVAGLLISWPAIFDRLRMAEAGAPRIQTWSMAAFLVGPLIVIGITLMLLGERTDTMLRDAERKKMKPLGNLIALACVITGFGGMLGTTYLLRSYGYL